MPETKKTGKTPGKRTIGKNGTTKKGKGKKLRPKPMKILDPFTGKYFEFTPHKWPGPGKGKIDPKIIREAVIKVRNERLAREKAAGTSTDPAATE
jgi:hypothetical protein